MVFPGAAPTAAPPDVPDEPDPPDRPAVTDEFTGSTLDDLQAFVDGVDDGAVIGFETDAVITGGASDGLDLTDRHDLTFVGRNATLQRTARGTAQIVQMNGQTSGIRWYDLTVEGQNPGEWDVTYEHEHAFALRSATDILFDNVGVLTVGGDGLYLSGVIGSIWSSNVTYQNGAMDGIGRNAVSVTDGAEDVSIVYNAIANVYYYTLDLEANGVSVDGRDAGALRVLFDHNAIGTHPYGNTGEGGPVGHFFAITGSSGGGPAELITVSNNTLSDGTMNVGVYNNGGSRQDIVFSGNVAVDTFTPDGDWTHCVNYSGVVGGSISDNTQPCSSPTVFSSVSGGSGVTVSGNTT